MPSGCFPHRCVRTPKTSWPPRCWLAVSLASTFNSVFIKNLSLRNTKYWIRSTKSTRDHDGLYWTINRRRGYSSIHLDRSYFDVCKGQGVGEWPCTARAWGTEHRTAGEARWAPENQRGRRARKRNSFPARAALGRCLPSASRTKTIRNVLTGYELRLCSASTSISHVNSWTDSFTRRTIHVCSSYCRLSPTRFSTQTLELFSVMRWCSADFLKSARHLPNYYFL